MITTRKSILSAEGGELQDKLLFAFEGAMTGLEKNSITTHVSGKDSIIENML